MLPAVAQQLPSQATWYCAESWHQFAGAVAGWHIWGNRLWMAVAEGLQSTAGDAAMTAAAAAIARNAPVQLRQQSASMSASMQDGVRHVRSSQDS